MTGPSAQLALRKLELKDSDRLCRWLPDAKQLLMWGGPFFTFPLRREDIAALVAQHRGDRPERECWAVTDSEGQLAGSFQLAYNDLSGQADLGRVLIDPALRGRGLAHPMLRLALDRAFARPEVHRIELRVFTTNAAAISAYRRIGFLHEGVRRESARLGESYFDVAVMGLLRHERPPA